jgi:hypothetical protein
LLPLNLSREGEVCLNPTGTEFLDLDWIYDDTDSVTLINPATAVSNQATNPGSAFLDDLLLPSTPTYFEEFDFSSPGENLKGKPTTFKFSL